MNVEFVSAGFPLITLSIVIPVVAAALLFVLKEELAKPVSIITSAIVFLISTFMLFAYDYSSYKIQFYEKYTWIPQLGVSYEVGVDALSLTMVWLTALAFLVSFIWSTNIQKRIKEYFISFLILEAACIGVLFHGILYGFIYSGKRCSFLCSSL